MDFQFLRTFRNVYSRDCILLLYLNLLPIKHLIVASSLILSLPILTSINVSYITKRYQCLTLKPSYATYEALVEGELTRFDNSSLVNLMDCKTLKL